MNFSAVILAGGKSSRMGRDKAWLIIEGQPLLARQIQTVRETGASEVFISGRDGVDYAEFGCPVLHDGFLDSGPLAGIERALAVCANPLLLALAVDMPCITSDVLRMLRVHCSQECGVVPRCGGIIEPVAAFYPKAALPMVTDLLRQNLNSVKEFSRNCARLGLARFIDLPKHEAALFANWNSPEDFSNLAVGAGLSAEDHRSRE